jgi:hypothetical protein
MPEDVQPVDAGQGSDGSGGLFDSYLQTVPEDGRDTVATYLKDASKQVESRLQEAAKIQQSLGPYQQVETLAQYSPEQLSELLAWHQQVTSDDETFREWLGNAAKEAGLTPAQEQAVEEEAVDGELTPEAIQKLIDERAAQQFQPLEQRLEQMEQTRQIDAEESEINQELSRLETESKTQFSKDQKAMILDLGLNHEGDGWVQAGFDRFKEITAEGQRAFLADKSAAPQTPVTAGGSDVFRPTTDFKEASKQARERWRQAQS